jgi:hypothetical protein
MTDPDDDWGDLARELGVQKPTPSAADASVPEAVEEPEPVHELPGATGDEEPEFADEAAGAEDGESDGEGEADDGTGDKPAGDGRKRRRRRRRRKKGEGDAADAGIADEPAPSYQAAGRAPVAPRVLTIAPVVAAEAVEDDAEGDDGEVGGPVSPAEEDTAGEVLRELIATWNVPSWDEIITGLHR